ncbi:MAG: adventurous gliding motility protein CglE [Caulobacterales bacterium]|nr:adventurous gliding motility protein CglE [Caulobacterales bacterium]
MNRPSILLAALAASLPGLASAGTPAAGVAQPIRSGFFADVDMGGFFTIGGQNSKEQSRPSNAQAYLQLGVGYDVAKNFSVAATFGIGSSAASCFADISKKGDCVANKAQADSPKMADNFTATMVTAEASYRHFFTDRLSLQPRLHLGYALLDPEPRQKADGTPITGGVVAGVGVGVEYATHMDHFSIGADIYGRLITGPNIFSMAFYPKIKYTF